VAQSVFLREETGDEKTWVVEDDILRAKERTRGGKDMGDLRRYF
jgi:hypothetical protein